MECATGGPPGEVEDAEWALVEILLRPLINCEKDIVHRSEEPRTGAVGFKLIWRERQEFRGIASAAAGFRTRHMHRTRGLGRNADWRSPSP